ncbi:MAG: 30S ribosome-binding factor RbfA [Saccharospirillum sp.]|nr:30S ribosome-binding factor RbfA [Saccharospirillum sp.]
MPKDGTRLRRIGDQIQRELSVLIQQEVKDPRLGMVTLNSVRVSSDLSYADIYFTCMVFGDNAEAQQQRHEQEAVLNKIAPFLRSNLAKLLALRIIPHLRFHYDEVVETGARLTDLISEAVRQDKARQGDKDSD